MLRNSFSPSPPCGDAAALEDACSEALKLFGDIFCESGARSFCCAAATRGIDRLRLSQQRCGMLLNASQHAMERPIEQLGCEIKPRKLPEAQLLSSRHAQLSLRILRGGASCDEQPSTFGDIEEGAREGENAAAAEPLGAESGAESRGKKLWRQAAE